MAWFGILGIAFAQLVVTAHACALGPPAAGEPAAAVRASPGETLGALVAAGDPCAAHAVGSATPATNLCEVHCTDGLTSAAAVDLPQVALAPLPVAVIPLVALAAAAPPECLHTPALSAGPPIVLQFGHLLI